MAATDSVGLGEEGANKRSWRVSVFAGSHSFFLNVSYLFDLLLMPAGGMSTVSLVFFSPSALSVFPSQLLSYSVSGIHDCVYVSIRSRLTRLTWPRFLTRMANISVVFLQRQVMSGARSWWLL